MTNDQLYAVRGVDEQGNVAYYTGKAGAAWMSANRSDAFFGYSLAGARRKALQFNANGTFGRFRFVAVSIEQ
jgi:hypothetical protein